MCTENQKVQIIKEKTKIDSTDFFDQWRGVKAENTEIIFDGFGIDSLHGDYFFSKIDFSGAMKKPDDACLDIQGGRAVFKKCLFHNISSRLLMINALGEIPHQSRTRPQILFEDCTFKNCSTSDENIPLFFFAQNYCENKAIVHFNRCRFEDCSASAIIEILDLEDRKDSKMRIFFTECDFMNFNSLSDKDEEGKEFDFLSRRIIFNDCNFRNCTGEDIIQENIADFVDAVDFEALVTNPENRRKMGNFLGNSVKDLFAELKQITKEALEE
ncbi:MAG: hypothetical protein U9O87_08875 [Verrucomicrobiota bacterium]|nr:hypothetical protein [Verrucomicrobiota bacterium]